ncbi:hypothetical protein PV11_07298 [Exophiala sideris]|uniref:Protein SYM1 n=1 Tax=Exophiala sideris TaxID=1016849 RepID=A0A0D1YY48_9EURO|nr:hypothetical protein PV11_07298 [Exophiala sideris]
MITHLRAPIKFGGRSPWLRLPRSRHQHAQRNSSNSTPPKDSTNAVKQDKLSPNTPIEIPIPGTKPEPIDVPIQLWYHRLGPVSSFFKWFNRTQVKRPYVVQVSMTLITYLLGDLSAQEIGGEPYSGTRTLRMLTIGAIGSIPGYKWFLFLGRNFNYQSKVASIATKVAINQVFFTPIFSSYFFGMQAFLTGESPSGVITRIKAAVPVSVVNSLKLWPAVTAFNFWVIPEQYRFMFSGIFAVAWQTYLSFLNRKEEKIELATDSMLRPVIPAGTVVK